MSHELSDEVTSLRGAVDRLQTALDEIALRGIRVAGQAEISKLSSIAEEFRTAGAGHLGDRLDGIVQAISGNDRGAVVSLLRAMTSARMFERMLTLEVCASVLESYLQGSSDAPLPGDE